MSRVFITDYITDGDIERDVLGADLTLEPGPDVEVILVWHQKVDHSYLSRFPKLRGVVRYGVGFDNIDLGGASDRGVVVCNTPDYGTDEVSDTAVGMMLCLLRGIGRYDAVARHFDSGWQEHTEKALRRTGEQHLLVIGAGRIGGSVSRKAMGLGLEVTIYDPYVARGYEKMIGTRRSDNLKETLPSVDIVSVHTPLTDETLGMIDGDFVDRMKPGAILVNTARGAILSDLDMLYDPLKSGRLFGAALDVLPEEPPRDGNLLRSWRKREPWLDGRLIINPHTAYYSKEAYFEMRDKAAKNALRILNGELPFNVLTAAKKELTNPCPCDPCSCK